MKLTKGDVVLVEFPFTDFTQTKLRPAIVLCANIAKDETTLCFITSQAIKDVSVGEFLLDIADPAFLRHRVKAFL